MLTKLLSCCGIFVALGLLSCRTGVHSKQSSDKIDGTDDAGNRECSRAIGPYTIQFAGKTYRGLDGEGVYFVETNPGSNAQDIAWPVHPNLNLQEIINSDRCHQPVKVKLIQFIDASDQGSVASEDAELPSRLKEIAGKTFRLTAAPRNFELAYFNINIDTEFDIAGGAHLLIVETPNDRERYTGITLTHPREGAWPAPFESEPVCPLGSEFAWWDCYDYCQEGDCFHPDVGVAFYAGREYPTGDQSQFNSLIFYPKMNQMRLTISSSGWYETHHEENGGAAKGIWVFKIMDSLEMRKPYTVSQGEGEDQRKIGVYFPHPWYMLAHYGYPVRTPLQRQQALGRFTDNLAFSGFNWLEFNVINGSDRSSHAWYDSTYFPQLGANLLSELPPIAKARGIEVVPVITSLLIPGSNGQLPPSPAEFAFSDESFQYLAANQGFTKAFGSRSPDPLRPEVQQWLEKFIDEIAAKSKEHENIKGIGIRVNGKIGLAYHAHEDGLKGAKESGYSKWNLQQFKQATGSSIPLDTAIAYDWLRARPVEWQKWIDYRCLKMSELWLAMRDKIKGYRPDWNLYLSLVLPSEVPGTNIEWVDEGFSAIELLKHHGYDPSLFRGEQGIVFERSMMIAEDRYYSRSRWAPPWGSNHKAYKDFHFQENLPELYMSAEGQALNVYFNYWEEAFHPEFEFGAPPNGMRTLTPSPPGRGFYEAMIFSLIYGNPEHIVLTGWQRPSLGHEHDLRRFSAAFKSIPRGPGMDFTGDVESHSSVIIKQFDSVIVVLNENSTEQIARITLPVPVPQGKSLHDKVTGKVYINSDQPNRQTFTLKISPWDMVTLAAD